MIEKDKIEKSIDQIDATLGMEGMHLTELEKENLKKIMQTQDASLEEINEIIKNIQPGETLLLRLYEEYLNTEKGKEKTK